MGKKTRQMIESGQWPPLDTPPPSGCFIVHHQSSPEAIEELGSVRPGDWDYDEHYLAISRDGLVKEAKTDQELINKLKDRKSQNAIV
jgi:hypothetical protein